MNLRTSKRRLAKANVSPHGTGTIKQLCRTKGSVGVSHHEANFSKILPSTMKKLVENGWFAPVGNTYKITEKGRQFLKDQSILDSFDATR